MSRLLAVAALVTGLAACASESPKFAFTSTERRGTIEANGLRFVIMPDTTTKLAEVDIRYDVGSREDPQGKAGIAHIVEHMMFQPRPDGPETAPLFQTIIDLATDFNAYTIWDRTHYRMTSASANLDSMLKIEALRMYFAADLPEQNGIPAFGCSTIPKPEFEREREVVRNEIRAQSGADAYTAQLVFAKLYPEGHAYQRLTGGNDQQIASVQQNEVCDFMKKYYTPDRATIVIAGNVNFEETVKLIQKWFGRIPKRTAAPRTPVTPFVVEHTQKTIEADVERPAVYIGWALPDETTPEGEAAKFGVWGAFGRILRASQQYDFAYSVEPIPLPAVHAPMFIIRIELKGMGKLDDALEFAKKSAAQAYRGWDEGTIEELAEEKNREKARFIERLERLSDRAEEVAELVQDTRDLDFGSDKMYLFHQLDKIEAFDGAKVAAATKKVMDWEKAGIVVVKPSEKGIKGDTRSNVKFSAKSDAAMTDPVVDPKEAKHPVKIGQQLEAMKNVQKFTLANGMDVVLLPVHSMPLASAVLLFKNVGQASTPENPALGGTVAEFLHRAGNFDPNSARNDDVFSRTGIEVGCRNTDDATYCSTHGVNIYLDVMIRGLERLVTAGEYSQDQIEQWQKRVKETTKLHSVQEDNEYARQVFASLYGPNHPYTKSAILRVEDANKIGKDALTNYKREHFTAGNATLIVVGDFKPEYAEKLARETFGGWSKGTVDKPVDPAPFKRTGPVVIGVQKGKVDQQITVELAYPAPAGIDGQEGAREVLATMLNNRAGDMRFKLGSTYGLYIARQAKKGPTAYALRGGAEIGGTIDAERAGETLKALRETLDDLRKGNHFDEDFVRARRQIISRLLNESTVTSDLAFSLARNALYGLDASFSNTMLQQVAAVSPAQIKALLAHELDPSNEVLVVLGDKAHLEKTFADAGLKDVKIVEPEYK